MISPSVNLTEYMMNEFGVDLRRILQEEVVIGKILKDYYIVRRFLSSDFKVVARYFHCNENKEFILSPDSFTVSALVARGSLAKNIIEMEEPLSKEWVAGIEFKITITTNDMRNAIIRETNDRVTPEDVNRTLEKTGLTGILIYDKGDQLISKQTFGPEFFLVEKSIEFVTFPIESDGEKIRIPVLKKSNLSEIMANLKYLDAVDAAFEKVKKTDK